MLVVCVVGAIVVQAQAPAAQKSRQFEVASVKPALSPAELGAQRGRLVAQGGSAAQVGPTFVGVRTLPGGRFSASTVTLRSLVARAFGVKDYQIQGGPAWASSDYFSIEAKADGDATTSEFNEMLRALLVERFGLRTRAETRQGKVYAVTLARADGRLGSGLKRSSEECVKQMEERKKTSAASAAASPSTPPTTASSAELAALNASLRLAELARTSATEAPPCGVIRMSSGTSAASFAFSGQPISTLVDRLANEVSAQVVDRTGLEGLFDAALEYESQIQRPVRVLGGSASTAPGGLDPNITESPKPPMPLAFERQLGLKVETTTGDVQVLVIDAAEKPTPD